MLLLYIDKWQWVEPSVGVFTVTRFFIITMWIICDPGSIPCGFSFMIAAVSYLFYPRAKFVLVLGLMWSVLAPYIAQRSPADLPPWIPVVALAIATLARLHNELQARSKFKDQYYPTTDSTETTKTTNSTATTETTKAPGTTDSTETIETTKTTDSTETEPPGPVERPACGLLHFCKRFFGFAGSAKEEQSVG
eukprot:gene4546-14724_t